jgi:hypothetical protein
LAAGAATALVGFAGFASVFCACAEKLAEHKASASALAPRVRRQCRFDVIVSRPEKRLPVEW